MDWQATRPGETSALLPDRQDAHLIFIGVLRTPFSTRDRCPRQGDSENGPVCRVEIDPLWQTALTGIAAFAHLDLLYWMHEARRDLVTQTPRGGQPLGTFALRSPVRPNPIALSRVALVGVEGHVLLVRGLDCLDGTPLLDVKPNRCTMAGIGASRPPCGGEMERGVVPLGEGSPGGATPTPIPSPPGGGEARAGMVGSQS